LKAAVAERRVPTDAALRAQARALGIEPPLTRRQLRRRSEEIAFWNTRWAGSPRPR
jgi:hypothetical protein